MRRLWLRIGLVAALSAGLLIPALPAFADFTDVPKSHWAYDAIMYMASDNPWMQDYGTSEFQPDSFESRKFLARTLVQLYAPTEPIDPTITFPDLPTDDPFYPYANVSVKLDWIKRGGAGKFNPDNSVKWRKFDKALIRAMGLWDEIDGLNALHQDDGAVYEHHSNFAEMDLARWFGFHYNHDDESEDLQINDKTPRAEVAWGIYTALNLSQWELDGATKFSDISLPAVNSSKEAMTQFMIYEVGPPYIWAGDWDAKSPPGYCCGYQPQGGFDCSGWVWWTTKKNEDRYNAAQFHPDYSGWHLAERTSSDMAAATVDHLKYGELEAGNLMFFASNGGNKAGDVDHVGVYLGNGWMFHSTGGGPFIEWVADGWYYDNFVWGRKLFRDGNGGAPRLPERPRSDVLAGEAPVTP
jgi:NlpC/P60 family protein/S-layer family protein